jgi:hypothetical protein
LFRFQASWARHDDRVWSWAEAVAFGDAAELAARLNALLQPARAATASAAPASVTTAGGFMGILS